MNRRAPILLLSFAATFFLATGASAQFTMVSTPNPTVTAENERWYLNGEPITYAGTFYYPAGPRVDFNADEMVRSGFFMGIPLYSRTTIEPFSVVYVPVGRAVMQPYERRRAGTSGSLPRSIPPVPGVDETTVLPLQAAGPPTQIMSAGPVDPPGPVAAVGSAPASAVTTVERPVATSGRVATPRRPTHSRIGGRPQGSNAIFIEFEGTRWYRAGAAEPIDTATLTRVGTYSGTPVWSKSGDSKVIYVPVVQGGASLAVPYSRTR